jgi:hypothetical protein
LQICRIIYLVISISKRFIQKYKDLCKQLLDQKSEMFLDSVVEGSIDGISYANYFYMLGFVIDSSLTFTWKENLFYFILSRGHFLFLLQLFG